MATSGKKKKKERAVLIAEPRDKREVVGICILLVLVWLVFLPSLFRITLIKGALVEAGVLCLVFVFFVKSLQKGRIEIIKSHLNRPLLGYVLFAGAMTLAAPYRSFAVEEFCRILAYAGLFWLVASRLTITGSFKAIRTAFFVTAWLTVSYGLLQKLGHDLFIWNSSGRIFSTFGNPNFYGSFLIASIPIIGGSLLVSRRPGRRFGLGVLMVLSLACLVFTLSRSAWVGFAASTVVMFVLIIYAPKMDRSFKKKTAIFPILVLAAGLLTIAVVPNVRHRALAVFSFSEGSVKFRPVVWSSTFRMFLAKPVFGHGLAQLRIFSPIYRNPFYGDFEIEKTVLHAHNEFLEILAELGIFGLALFAVFFVTLIVSGVRAIRQSVSLEKQLFVAGLVSSIVALLVQSFFSVSLRWTAPATMFWALAGTLAASVGFSDSFWKGKVKGPQLEFSGDSPPLHSWKLPSRSSCRLWLTAVMATGALVLVFSVESWVRRLRSNALEKRTLTASSAGMYEKGIRYGEKAVRLNPLSVLSLYAVAYCQNSLGLFDEAAETYNRVNSVWPNYLQVHYNLGMVYLNLRKTEMAKKELEAASRLESSTGIIAYARFLAENGDKEQAIELLRNVVSRPSVSMENLKNAARLARDIGQNDVALHLYERFFEEGFSDIDAELGIARIYNEKKDYIEAIKHYKAALRLSPKRIATHVNLGSTYLASGDIKNAIKHLQDAISLDPDNALAHYNLGVAYMALKKPRNALVEFETVLKVAPDTRLAEEARRHITILRR